MLKSTLRVVCFVAACVSPCVVLAQGTAELAAKLGSHSIVEYPIGVTAKRATVTALVAAEDFDVSTRKTRILLVGQSQPASDAIGGAMTWFYTNRDAQPWRERFLVSAAPFVPPGDQSAASAEFPPQGVAYTGDAPQLHYLWRWIGMHAPDLVVEVRSGAATTWYVPPSDDLPQRQLASVLTPAAEGGPNELAAALVRFPACSVGRISAVRVTTAGEGESFISPLLAALASMNFEGPSPARRELQQRLARTPLQAAQQLSEHYGQTLPQAVYIPAMALVGRVRLGELTDDPSHLTDVARIVAPYVSGDKTTPLTNGSALSGRLIFSELAQRSDETVRTRYLAHAREAADLAFDEQGAMRPSMPHHDEMSDALFMGAPILAHVGKLSGESRYFAACMQHLRFMRKLDLREDGFYRHSPLDEAAWGRGNGFPALGLALCLTHWPSDREGRTELLAMFREHMAALKPHQDRSGCWRQVIDHPDSYRELSCTCMIAFAAARGVQQGWLERDEYDTMIRTAWSAILARVGANGELVDVCTGTGKQKSLEDYYLRPAILGRDDRGGAMALLAATELAQYLKTFDGR
jgi:rhamnogalacturonyl hydrolase YesR